MRLNSDTPPLAAELRDPEIRRHTVESQIKIGIPFQIRSIRDHRGWTQEKLAEKIGTTQNTISRLENPKLGKPTITTLLRIANACDVGLLVRFVPFGFYGDVIQAMDASHIDVPSYDEELKNQTETDKQNASDSSKQSDGNPATEVVGGGARAYSNILEFKTPQQPVPNAEWIDDFRALNGNENPAFGFHQRKPPTDLRLQNPPNHRFL